MALGQTVWEVLIVDDNEELWFSLSKVVTRQGYSVETAPSGQTALDIINSAVIDLIFLDIGLPDIDGISLISEFKDTHPDVGIVRPRFANREAVPGLPAGQWYWDAGWLSG